MAAPARVVFALLVVTVLLLGLYDVLRNYEENKCEMTWMFEEPKYLPIKLPKKVERKFPRYGLYFYGEGGYANAVKKAKFALFGVPVLFIPGNSGSYKQVRSLGSVALRKAENINNFFHFNYFSVDLNEELSGFDGNALYEQTNFVNLCIQKILSLYKSSKTPPTSVILVGHSMGGMVARALFTLSDFQQTSVRTIITQATPHQGIVLQVDHHVAQFYRDVNNYWRDNMNGSLRDVTVVSTGGGFRDVQIRQDLTSLENIVADNVSISTSTMSVPKAWVSTDHLCAVWCRQMVFVTQRAIFDMVDRTTLQENTDPKNKMSVLKYHFLQNEGTEQYLPPSVWEKTVQIVQEATWEKITTKQWSITRDISKEHVYLTVPISSDRDKILVAISNARIDNFIFACKMISGKQDCEKTLNLSPQAKVIPPKDYHKRFIQVSLKKLSEYSHVVFVIPRNEDKAVVYGEIISRKQKDTAYKLPSFSDFIWSFHSYIFSEMQIYSLKGHYSVFRNISLEGFDNIFKTYTIYMNTTDCKASKDVLDGSVMSIHYPSMWQDTYSFVKQGYSGDIKLKRQSFPTGDNSKAQLHLYLQTGCSYRISIKISILDFLGQFARYYSPLIIGYVIANLLMAFMGQLRVLNRGLFCPTFQTSLAANCRPYNVVLVAELLRYVLSLDEVKRLLGLYTRIPDDDSVALSELGVWSRLVSFTMCVLALGLLTFHAFIVRFTIRWMGKALCKVCCCPAILYSFFTLVKYVLILGSLGVSVYVCGTLGILVCFLLQLLKVLGLRCDYERRIPNKLIAGSKFNFHFSVFILQLWFLLLNAVSLAIWFRQIEFSYRLEVDSSRIPAIVSIVAFFIISYWDEPIPCKGAYSSVCFMLFVQVTGVVLYGIYSVYRLSYVLCIALLCIAIPQLLSNLLYRSDQKKKVEKVKTK